MKDLPNFQRRSFEATFDFISAVLTTRDRPDDTLLVELIQYEDGHYRAVFDPVYFTLQPGRKRSRPGRSGTRSRKSSNATTRRFSSSKNTARLPVKGPRGGRCYYLDFGFLAG